MRTAASLLLITVAACSPVPTDPVDHATTLGCREISRSADRFTVCSYDLRQSDVRLFHSDADGKAYRQFDVLASELGEQGETLIFAMNGGMYHEDRRPVGFFRDDRGDQANVNIKDGPGNFHLKPNGVFWISGEMAGVTESAAFLEADLDPQYATQSGPMLVIEDQLHPEFNPDGTSRKRRNGVGVSEDGHMVHFAISDTFVTFHGFASLFRDDLSAPNALFLDGQVSRIYAPSINRSEAGLDLGPIVGVVEQR